MRKLAPILVVMTLTATRLEAQYARRYEVGLFGAYTRYDKAFGLADKPGGGVRFAYALTPMIDLEVEALFQSPQDVGTAHIEPLIGSGSLVVNALNASRMSVYVLGGYSRLDFGGTNPYRFTDGGFHGGAGAKFFMSSRVALRFEARGIYTPSTTSAFPGGSKNATHLMASAGFAFFQPDAAPAADADHDGVADKLDACPDTPRGAAVDNRGCPADADSDGVLNGIDQCPNTPTGATVDATGCPHDQDGDKVFDGIDQCPNTPAGAAVDAKGCPLAAAAPAGLPDADGDGVNDLLDKCRIRLRVQPSIRRDVRSIPITTASGTDSTSARIHQRARPSMRMAARWIPTATRSSTGSIAAPTPLPAHRSTRSAVRQTATRTACLTVWTSAPTRRRAFRSMPTAVPLRTTPMVTASLIRRIAAQTRRRDRASINTAACCCSKRKPSHRRPRAHRRPVRRSSCRA